MAELEDLISSNTSDGSTTNPLETIEIEWLDFDYVKECQDIKKLQGILNTLKSGKEGYYPELLKYTEDKLLSFLSDSDRKRVYGFSKIKPSISDVSYAENDLKEWMKNIKLVDSTLSHQSHVESPSPVSSSSTQPNNNNSNHSNTVAVPITEQVKSLPAVRGAVSNTVSSTNSNSSASGNILTSASSNTNSTVKNTSSSNNSDNGNTSKVMFVPSPSSITDRKRISSHIDELNKLRIQLRVDESSSTQCQLKADRERVKGNEHYKAKEYTQAIDCYTRSMAYTIATTNSSSSADALNISPLSSPRSLPASSTSTLSSTSTPIPPVAIIYTNRALAYSQLNQLEAAEMDCSIALQVDEKNIKALSKRSAIRFKKGQYKLSILDLMKALQSNPDNTELKSQLQKSLNKYQEVEGKAFVYEVEEEEEEEEGNNNNNVNNSNNNNNNNNNNDNNSSGGSDNDDTTKIVLESQQQAAKQQVSAEKESYRLLTNNYATNKADFDSFVAECCDTSNGSNNLAEVVSSGLLLVQDTQKPTITTNYVEEIYTIDTNDINISMNSDPTENFTRVAIIEDDDDDDEDEEQQIANTISNSNSISNITNKEAFTRVVIIEDDDDGDDSDTVDDHLYAEATAATITTGSSTEVPTASTADISTLKSSVAAVIENDTDNEHVNVSMNSDESFTRISISEGNDDDDEEEEQGHGKQNSDDRDISNKIAPQPSPISIENTTTSGVDGTAIDWKEQGNKYMAAKNYTAAIDCYTKSITLDSTLIASYNNRSQSYITLKLYKEAIADCTTVLQLDSQNVKALYRRALCYKELQQLTHAQSDLKSFFSIEKHQGLQQNIQAHQLAEEIMAAIDIVDNENEGNEAANKNTISKSDNINTTTIIDINDETNNNLSFEMLLNQHRLQALACLEQGNLDAAILSFLTTLKLLQSSSSLSSLINKTSSEITDVNMQPSEYQEYHISTLNFLLTCYFAKSDYQAVVTTCSQLLAIDSSHFRARLKRAEAYYHLGEYDQSLEDTAAALDTDPSSIEAQTLLNELTKKMSPEVVAKFNKIRNQIAASDTTNSTNTPNVDTINTIKSTSNNNSNVTQVTTDITSTTSTSAVDNEKLLSSSINKISSTTAATAFAQQPLKLQFTSYMDKGNTAIAKNESKAAVDFYTLAIDLCNSNINEDIDNKSDIIDLPTKLSCYYNRAQSYIKCLQYDKAETDAAYVVNHAKSCLNNINDDSASTNTSTTSTTTSKEQTEQKNKILRLYRNALHLQGISLKNLGSSSSSNNNTSISKSATKTDISSSASSLLEQQIKYLEHSLIVFQELVKLLYKTEAKDVETSNKIKKEVDKVNELLLKKRKLNTSTATSSALAAVSTASAADGSSNTKTATDITNKSNTTTNASTVNNKSTTVDNMKPAKSMNSSSASSSNLSNSACNKPNDNAELFGMTAVKTTKYKPTTESSSLITTPLKTATESTVTPTTAASAQNNADNNTLQQLVDQGVVKLPKNFISPSATKTSQDTEKVPSSISPTPGTNSNSKVKSKIQVPTVPPKTVYECERVWRSLKSHPDLFAEYLSTFTAITFKKAFKESLSPELISSVLVALRDYICDEKCVFVLSNLAKYASSFTMMVQLLPEDDIKCLQSIFVKLELNSDGDSGSTSNEEMRAKIIELKQLYRM